MPKKLIWAYGIPHTTSLFFILQLIPSQFMQLYQIRYTNTKQCLEQSEI